MPRLPENARQPEMFRHDWEKELAGIDRTLKLLAERRAEGRWDTETEIVYLKLQDRRQKAVDRLSEIFDP